MLHPNLKLLSHSSLNTLDGCGRKFELSKLLNKEPEDDRHTVFGSAFGGGIELMVQGGSLRDAMWYAFTHWRAADLTPDERTEKDGKAFYDCIIGFRKFVQVLENFIKRKYTVLTINGKPASELGFRLELTDGFWYRGFIDVVLLDRETGELVVLELKTTKSTTVHPATFKNSGQALGYSLILDTIAHQSGVELGSSYKVIYLIYKTKSREFEIMPFDKYHVERANWLRQLVIKTQVIELYDRFDMFPKMGQNCYAFFKPCEFFDTCNLSNSSLLAGKEPELKEDDPDKYQYTFNLDEIINGQLAKGATE